MHVAAAKLLALVVLGLVRLCFALLPVFALAVARPSPRRLDQLMRFGGGVLLATFLLHMLPEAREGIPDAAEAVALVGFFVVYLLEEALHRPQKTPTVAPEAQAPCCATVELDPRKSPAPLTATWSGPRCPRNCCRRPQIAPTDSTQHLLAAAPTAPGAENCTWVLIAALGVHSLLEGLAVGLQNNPDAVWVLVVAVSVHAVPLLLCVGAKVAASKLSRTGALTRLCLLALSAPLGGLLGMAMGDVAHGEVAASLQALAAGTLLYAAMAEALVRRDAPRSISGALFAILGFLLILTLQLLVRHDHETDEVDLPTSSPNPTNISDVN